MATEEMDVIFMVITLVSYVRSKVDKYILHGK